MTETVDQAQAQPPRALAGIIEDATSLSFVSTSPFRRITRWPPHLTAAPYSGKAVTSGSATWWLAACFERGAIAACFVAAPEFGIIQLHSRCRRDLTGGCTWERQRAGKLLELAIKISSVLTGLHGGDWPGIIGRLIAGERSPMVLAQFARAAACRKVPPASQLELQQPRIRRGVGTPIAQKDSPR